MTTATPTSAPNGTPPPAQPGSQFANALAEALRGAVSVQAKAPWTSRVIPQAPQATGAPAETADQATVSLRLSGDLTGELFLSLQLPASAELLSALEPASAQDPGQAWLTLCAAAGEILLGSSAPPFEAITIDSCQLGEASADSKPLAHLELATRPGTPGALISMRANAAMMEHLASLQTELDNEPSPLHEAEAEVDPTTQIDRVIDVPLAVTLRFGQRHLTLREVLALNSGSLVELDRQVEEPVDLVLGDRLIARGEVVIVDGNYGLRVTEVVQGAANRIRRAQAANALENATPRKATA